MFCDQFRSDWPDRCTNAVPFLFLLREKRESDDDIFNPLKGKAVYRERGEEYVLLQGNCICQCSRSHTEPDNLTIGKS